MKIKTIYVAILNLSVKIIFFFEFQQPVSLKRNKLSNIFICNFFRKTSCSYSCRSFWSLPNFFAKFLKLAHKRRLIAAVTRASRVCPVRGTFDKLWTILLLVILMKRLCEELRQTSYINFIRCNLCKERNAQFNSSRKIGTTGVWNLWWESSDGDPGESRWKIQE